MYAGKELDVLLKISSASLSAEEMQGYKDALH